MFFTSVRDISAGTSFFFDKIRRVDCHVRKSEDRFRNPVGGYRGIICGLTVDGAHIVETQFHLLSMKEAKSHKVFRQQYPDQWPSIANTVGALQEVGELPTDCESVLNNVTWEKGVSGHDRSKLVRLLSDSIRALESSC